MLDGSSERERALVQAALDQGVVDEGELRAALAGGDPLASALRRAAGSRAWQLDVIEQGLPAEAASTREPAPAQAPRWQLGEEIEGYRLVRLLGSGGMGKVFLAEDSAGTPFALKTLAREADAELRARFRREGEAQARADGHPNVLRVRRSGEVAGQAFLVLDVAQGGDLSDRLEAGPLEVDSLFELGITLADAIGHAHEQGVFHRDLKPSNVLFDESGAPQVCDFGLAALRGAESLTQSGATLGTPSYMAPEQADSTRGSVDERTDVYGLGAVLFAAATGRPPFEAEGRVALVTALLLKEAPRARTLRPELPQALEAVLEICLRKEPEGRFPNAAALRDALADAREGITPDRRNPGRRRRSRKRLLLVALLVSSLAAAIGAASYAFGGRAEAPTPSPTATPVGIELSDPPTVSYRSSVTLVGRVGGARASKLRVAGKRPVRLDSEGGFRLRVDLAEGPNVLQLEALDRAGEVISARSHELSFLQTPSWWRRLPEARRPHLPLPTGLRFGEDPGIYRYREGSTLVWIPPGTFTMGRTEEGFVHGGVEGDQHGERNLEVTFSRGYFMGKFEVSWGQYVSYCEATNTEVHDRRLNFRIERTAATLGARPIMGEGTDFTPGDDYPVHGLSWIVADDYTRFYGLRLPTEAEWEYAARGQQVGSYPWGDVQPTSAHLNRHDPADGYPYTAPVDSFAEGASPFGCLHMAGNVSEFTSSYYAPYPKGPVVDWAGPAKGQAYVVRGWGFLHTQPQLFSVYHRWTSEAIRPEIWQGFRVALSHSKD